MDRTFVQNGTVRNETETETRAKNPRVWVSDIIMFRDSVTNSGVESSLKKKKERK